MYTLLYSMLYTHFWFAPNVKSCNCVAKSFIGFTYRVAFGPTAFSAKQKTACKF